MVVNITQSSLWMYARTSGRTWDALRRRSTWKLLVFICPRAFRIKVNTKCQHSPLLIHSKHYTHTPCPFLPQSWACTRANGSCSRQSTAAGRCTAALRRQNYCCLACCPPPHWPQRHWPLNPFPPTNSSACPPEWRYKTKMKSNCCQKVNYRKHGDMRTKQL